VLVADFRHYLDMPDDVPSPARRLAEQLSMIVRAATSGAAGVAWASALSCPRRPELQPCPGHIVIARTDIPSSIEWRCTACGDDGVISGWERTAFDLRPRSDDPPPSEPHHHVVITPTRAAVLRSLMMLDSTTERIVFGARLVHNGIALAGTADDLDELLDSVAAEANHEPTKRRQRLLDACFNELQSTIERL